MNMWTLSTIVFKKKKIVPLDLGHIKGIMSQFALTIPLPSNTLSTSLYHQYIFGQLCKLAGPQCKSIIMKIFGSLVAILALIHTTSIHSAYACRWRSHDYNHWLKTCLLTNFDQELKPWQKAILDEFSDTRIEGGTTVHILKCGARCTV